MSVTVARNRPAASYSHKTVNPASFVAPVNLPSASYPRRAAAPPPYSTRVSRPAMSYTEVRATAGD
jgi:hypothetical protein